jgi:hypothetical protein
MPSKRKSSANEGIQATNVSAQAIAVGRSAQAIVNQTTEAELSDQVKGIFAALAQKVAELPDGPDKDIARSAVSALETEARLGDNAKEANVTKWLKFLAQTAPDIWDVAIATFANPVAGMSIVFKKIADRAREEQEKAKEVKK